MNTIIEQIRAAHEAAYNAYSILSEVSEQLRESNNIEADFEASVEELTEIADNLQASLFDLIENNKTE